MFSRPFFLFILIALGLFAARSQGNATPAPEGTTISGFVADSANGETLIGATVSIKGEKLGSITNKSGYFVIQGVNTGKHTIRATYLGYRPKETTVNVGTEPVKLRIMLARQDVKGESITVEATREEEQHEIKISTVSVSAAQIQSMPAFGESDLFRALQYLPGVLTSSQISSGLYIRGGSPDQNLVLLDGSTLYNPSHLFGFFSTFNNDAIKNVELIKGGFPAEFGGRLSAVINVTNKDGDREHAHGQLSLGLISSRLTLETPLGNGAVFVSGRRTYIDLLTGLLPDDPTSPIPSYYFYDLNGKATQNLGGADKVSLSGYGGADKLGLNGGGISFLLNWGNRAGAARWTHLFSDNLVSDVNLTASHYYSGLQGDNGGYKFTLENDITDYTLKANVDYYLTQEHLVKAGVEASQYVFSYQQDFSGGDSTAQQSNDSTNLGVNDKAVAFFIQDAWQASSLLALQFGLRADWEELGRRVSFDPRFSARYILTDDIALKASWGVYHQYLHLAAQEGFSFFDVWLPSDSTVGASQAIQYIGGVESHPWDGYDFNVEGYYKALSNITSFRNYVIRAKTVGQIFSIGTGQAYGVEFFLQKKVGPLTGWIGYSLAWVTQKFPDINNGNAFPPKYDRRHDVNIVGTYKLSDRWRVGAAWVYGTGQTYTAATSRFRVQLPDASEGVDYTYPGDRNALRLPASHRLDANVSYETTIFGYASTLSLDIFNVYSHRDIWFRFYDTKKNPTEVTDVRLLPIIPTFSMDVKF